VTYISQHAHFTNESCVQWDFSLEWILQSNILFSPTSVKAPESTRVHNPTVAMMELPADLYPISFCLRAP